MNSQTDPFGKPNPNQTKPLVTLYPCTQFRPRAETAGSRLA